MEANMIPEKKEWSRIIFNYFMAILLGFIIGLCVMQDPIMHTRSQPWIILNEEGNTHVEEAMITYEQYQYFDDVIILTRDECGALYSLAKKGGIDTIVINHHLAFK